jgi:DNA-binding IclR family transcriptional regulator
VIASDDATSREAPVPAVTRAFAILDLLAKNPGARPSTGEIARELQLPKSSTANICNALESAGLIRRNGRGYGLGRRLVELGGAYLSSVDPVQEFYEFCPRAGHLAEETVRLAVLDGADVIDLARYEGRQPIRFTSTIGNRLPASCSAAGKALLSGLDPLVVADRFSRPGRLPALTPRSVASLPELLADLEGVRERGYAVDDEETMPGVVSLAIAVADRGHRDGAVAVGVTILKARLTDGLERHLLADLRTLAAQLTDGMHR